MMMGDEGKGENVIETVFAMRIDEANRLSYTDDEGETQKLGDKYKDNGVTLRELYLNGDTRALKYLRKMSGMDPRLVNEGFFNEMFGSDFLDETIIIPIPVIRNNYGQQLAVGAQVNISLEASQASTRRLTNNEAAVVFKED